MTLTLAQAITVAILAVSCFFCGWFFYRLRAKAREAELNRALLDTKGVIPQLESSVRNREQRVSALCTEVGDWKNRHASVESSLKEKDREILARDRALRALNAELTMLKEAQTEDQQQTEVSADAESVVALQHSLAEALARCAELERNLDRAHQTSDDSAAIQPAVDASVENNSRTEDSQMRERISSLEAELTVRDATCSDLEVRLKAEAVHSRELGDAIEKQAAEIAREKEELGKWRARVPKLVDSIREKDARLAESTQRAEALAQSLAAAQSENRTVADELAGLRVSFAEANTQLETLRAREETLVLERDELARRVEAGETAASATQQVLSAKESELVHLKTQLENAQRSVKDGQAEFAKKLATSIRLGREEVDRLNQEADRLTHELGAAITARNDSTEARSGLEELTRSRAAEIDKLRTERDAAVELRSSLESELAGLVERNAGTTEECSRLERRVGELEGDLSEALARLTQLDAAQAERHVEQAGFAEQLAERDTELKTLREEIHEWHSRLAPLESLVKQRDATLAARATRIEELQAQVASLESELADRSQRASQREREFLAAQTSPKDAKPDPKSDYLETRVANQFEKNRELMAALEERNKAITALQKDRDLKDKSMTVLRQQLEQERDATDRLATQLREVRARTDDERPAQPDDSVEPEKPKDLFTSAPDDKDDLQQIRGIGAAFEHRLNVLGVYQYRQIAGFSDSELVWLENELRTFRGRVGRDDWVGQAVALMAPPPASKALVLAQSTSL